MPSSKDFIDVDALVNKMDKNEAYTLILIVAGFVLLTATIIMIIK